MAKQVVEYNITDAAIAEMENLYMALTITDLGDQEQFDSVHSARMVVKGKRVEVEKTRKDLKKEAIAWGKKVDGEAKRIFSLLEPIETHLITEEKKVTDEQKRIQEENDRIEKLRIQGMIETLQSYGCVMSFMDVAVLSEDEYESIRFDAHAKWKDEQDRIAAEKAEREAEERRLAEERAELEKIRTEQAERDRKVKEEQERIAKEQAEAQAKIDAESAKVTADHRAASLTIARARYGLLRAIGFVAYKDIEYLGELSTEEWEGVYDSQKAAHEKHKADAKAKSEQDAKDKAEQVAREKKEREDEEAADLARQEALKPDREKILAWVRAINDVPKPDIADHLANVAFSFAVGQVNIGLKNLRKAMEKL